MERKFQWTIPKIEQMICLEWKRRWIMEEIEDICITKISSSLYSKHTEENMERLDAVAI